MEEMVMYRIDSDFWKARRVLITGHTGFKGSWLALWLLELGAEVYGLSLDVEPYVNSYKPLFVSLGLANRLGRNNFIGDIRDRSNVVQAVDIARPDVVFHLAAQPLVRRSYTDPLGTWSTNVQGSLQLLEALRLVSAPCSVVLVTTDKVYANREWEWGYREDDLLGGQDPYSASKAAMEILASSWRDSFCGHAPHQTPLLSIATARAGNVIGGGDWASDRIVPDAIRCASLGELVTLRNPRATRPWQHVLEPLAGYLKLAERLIIGSPSNCSAFNFGPDRNSNRSVVDLIEHLLKYWPGAPGWRDGSDANSPHESALLHLVSDRARNRLGWRPRWAFEDTVARTAQWYLSVHEGSSALDCCLNDLSVYGGTNDEF